MKKNNFRESYKYLTKRLAVMAIKYVFGTRPSGKIFDGAVQSIVILGPERFGDLIVLTPMIRALRSSFPEAGITLLGVTNMVSFLSHDPNLNRVVNIKRTRVSERREILRDHYDLLFNPKDHPSFTFLLLTARINARYKIGIYHRAHIGYFDYMHFFDDAAPTVEKNMVPLHFLDISFEKRDLRPYLPDGEISSNIKEFIEKLDGVKPVGINLSASNPGKEWPLENWRALISEIDRPVVILAMPDDAGKKKLLEREFKQVVPSPPTGTLLDAGYLIAQLDLLVTTDTALVHVAGCCNTPVVVLYRLERDMKKFPPASDLNRILISPTSDLADISPDQVTQAVKNIR
jgi:ADP-heptose:LPS heptosyltransferase